MSNFLNLLQILLLWLNPQWISAEKVHCCERGLSSFTLRRTNSSFQRYLVSSAEFTQVVGVTTAMSHTTPSAPHATKQTGAAEDVEAAVQILQALRSTSSMQQLTSLAETMQQDLQEVRAARTEDDDFGVPDEDLSRFLAAQRADRQAELDAAKRMPANSPFPSKPPGMPGKVPTTAKASSVKAIPPKSMPAGKAKASAKPSVKPKVALPLEELKVVDLTADERIMVKSQTRRPEEITDFSDALATLSQLQDWNWKVLQAWSESDKVALRNALVATRSLRVSPENLRGSGSGALLNTSLVWTLLDSSWEAERQLAISRWKKQLRAAQQANPGALAAAKPEKSFTAYIDEMEDHLKDFRRSDSQLPACKAVAIHLVGRGFKQTTQLEGLDPELAVPWGRNENEKMLLAAVIQFSEDQARKKRDGWQRLNAGNDPANCLWLVENLTEEKFVEAQASLEELGGYNCPPAGPAATIQELTSRATTDVLACADERVRLLKLHNQRKSFGPLASGLRCWHGYATLILSYPDSSSLPPRKAIDVLRFLTIFKHAGTARNYVGYVKWACAAGGLSTAWYTEEVKLTLKGLRKEMLQRTIGELRVRCLMSDDVMGMLCTLTFNLLGKYIHGTLYLVSYEFLLRVVNEALPLEKGTTEELLSLPQGRHSAVFVTSPQDALPELVIRLRTRKHRPQGSILRRQCTCKDYKTLEEVSTCVVHRVKPLLEKLEVGQQLFSCHNSSQYLQALRSTLQLLDVPMAANYTWKAFRAGKAAALAAQGASLQKVLQSGDWRSAAILNYADEDCWKVQSFLEQAAGLSDEEEM